MLNLALPVPASRLKRLFRLERFSCTNMKGTTVISKKATVAICATVGVALSGFAFAVPAQADPVSNSYSIVGSDTLEDVVSALVNGSSISGSFVRTTTLGSTLGSFDATGSDTILAKPGGMRFSRPNGSGDGAMALSRSISGAPYTGASQLHNGLINGVSTTVTDPAITTTSITGQVDIARSSSAGTPNSAGTLLYVPFGRDAIAVAYDSRSDNAAQTAFAAGLSASDLYALYNCTVTTVGGVTVTPYIPQAGSGTRKDFLKKIGIDTAGKGAIPSGNLKANGGCIVESQEHDATALVANSFMPMSVSRWIAMNTGASINKVGYGLISGVTLAGSEVSPVTGTGSSMAPNAAYYVDSVWGRDTYLVVEAAKVTSGASFDQNLADLIDPTKSTSLTNTNSTFATRSGAVKKKFGMLAPSTTTPFNVLATS